MFVELIAALSLVAAAQQAPPAGMTSPPQRMQPRDPATEKKGTATIKGRVTSGDSGRPLRRVQVRLTAPELTEPRTTSTNLQGAYEFAELPAGRYTLSVSRSGYLSLQYGQRRPGEPPKPLQVSDGQAVEKLDFALPRSGVISGRLSDETGDAFAGVAVYAMQTQFFQGRRSLVPISMGGRSDDAGQYRLVGLSPGDYVVMATIRETWTTDGKEKQVFAYAPSYFPGTASAADATRVKVGIGQEVGGIDMSLQPMRAANVSGTALASDGTPLSGGNINLSQEIVGPGGGSFSGHGRHNDRERWQLEASRGAARRIPIDRTERQQPRQADGDGGDDPHRAGHRHGGHCPVGRPGRHLDRPAGDRRRQSAAGVARRRCESRDRPLFPGGAPRECPSATPTASSDPRGTSR